eukprot:11209408-Lingulodinium_polyedra.AAC.1
MAAARGEGLGGQRSSMVAAPASSSPRVFCTKSTPGMASSPVFTEACETACAEIEVRGATPSWTVAAENKPYLAL